jgi:hypothetical protein
MLIGADFLASARETLNDGVAHNVDPTFEESRALAFSGNAISQWPKRAGIVAAPCFYFQEGVRP